MLSMITVEETAKPSKSRTKVAVAPQEGGGGGRRRLGLAGGRPARAVEEVVGHPGEGRDHDDERAAVGADERDCVAHGGGVGEGRTAELPDLQPRPAAAHALSSHRNAHSNPWMPGGHGR